jgi:hypothetical protein
MGSIRTVLAGDPKLTPLTQRVDNIIGDYNRNPYRDLPNDQFIDHNKKRNHDLIVVADQTFSKDNRNPVLSANPEISRTSTVKIYQNDNNSMTRFEVDKEYPGDKVNVIQVRTSDIPLGSSGKRRPSRIPAKQQVNVDKNALLTNPDYDPNNHVKSYIYHEEAKEASNNKVIFANDTDPVSATQKKKAPVERYVVVQQVDSSIPTPIKSKEDPYIEKVVITSNDYKDTNPKNQYEPVQMRPQPFQQYPIFEKKAIEPASSERYIRYERAAYYKVPTYGDIVYYRKVIDPASAQRNVSYERATYYKVSTYAATVYYKKAIDPASAQRNVYYERAAYYKVPTYGATVYYRKTIEPDFRIRTIAFEYAPYYFKPKPIKPTYERKFQEAAHEIKDFCYYMRPRPKLLPRSQKFIEARDISIQYPAQFFSQQQILKEIPLETGSLVLPQPICTESRQMRLARRSTFADKEVSLATIKWTRILLL